MKLDEDQVLITKILEGCHSSFEELMRKYNRKMYNFILRMVRDEEIAIELTQDLFVKIYTVLEKYNFSYKFSTWVYRICYNLVIDYIRKKQDNVDSFDYTLLTKKQIIDSGNYSGEDGFEVCEKEEMSQYLWSVVERLPDKFRELIFMRYIQELKYEEIAEVADLPVGTVKNRIFKAKELLKVEIDKDGVFDKK